MHFALGLTHPPSKFFSLERVTVLMSLRTYLSFFPYNFLPFSALPCLVCLARCFFSFSRKKKFSLPPWRKRILLTGYLREGEELTKKPHSFLTTYQLKLNTYLLVSVDNLHRTSKTLLPVHAPVFPSFFSFLSCYTQGLFSRELDPSKKKKNRWLIVWVSGKWEQRKKKIAKRSTTEKNEAKTTFSF